MIHTLRLILIYVVTAILYGCAIVLFSSLSNFDTDSYVKIGTLTWSGTNVYPDPAISRHPYLPFFLYFEAAAVYLHSVINVPVSILLKIFISLFHLFSIYSIYHLSKKNIKTTLFYALNPVSLLIITFHGQFDIIPLSWLLFCIILIKQKKYSTTLFMLSLAVTIKTWPLLFVIPYLRRIPYKYYPVLLLAPIMAIGIYLYFFDTNLWSIIRVLLVYQGVQGVWGFGALLSFFSIPKLGALIAKVLLVLVMMAIAYRQKQTTLTEEVTSLMLLFFVLTPGFGIQWFIWLVPFLFLSKKPFIGMLSIPIAIALIISYTTWLPSFSTSQILANSALMALYPLFFGYYIVQLFFRNTSKL